MPAGKYYCDYCDKEFQDTPAARKRHLLGTQHQRNKALWFDSINRGFNQIPTGSTQSFTKGVCNRFVRTGFCPYGDSCKYAHPRQNLHSQNVHGAATRLNDNLQPREVDDVGGNWSHGGKTNPTFGMSLGNLPPSLQPPPEGGYPPLPYIDWG